MSLTSQSSFSPRLGGVAGLDFLASPAAIAWFVVSVVIDAIERGSQWALAHVGEKIVKQFPRLTKGYASSTVLVPAIDVGVCASLFHGRPRVIGPRISAFPRMTVPKLSGAVSLYTTATMGFAFDRACGGYRNFVAAFAAKNPTSVLSLNVREPERRQATVTKSGMISAGRHD